MAKGDIYSLLDSLRPVVWKGSTYRHTARTIERGRVLNGEGAMRAGGRWNPPDSFRTVYLSLEVETLVAEFRKSVAPERDQAEVASGRYLWDVRISLSNLVDLRPIAHRQLLGLPDPFDERVPRRVCQDIGDAAYYVRYKGLLVPSAARNGAINVVVFPDHLESGDVMTIVGEPRPMSDYVA